MNGGFPTAVALIVCTALGAVGGFLAARLFAARNVGKSVATDEPAPAFEAVDVDVDVDVGVVQGPATGVARAEETTAAGFPVDLPAQPTDAEIDALPPELPPLVPRRQRKAPPSARRFDRL